MEPQRLGSRYLLHDQIGQGAMGVVWRGLDLTSGSEVAIKLLRPEFAANPASIARFVGERNALMRFRHPNVVNLRDMIVEGDRLALVMDLVSGGDLDAFRQRNGGTLAAGLAAGLTAQICDGLAAAHAADIIHRDLKPSNVLLEDGQVRLADFGIARIVGEGKSTTAGMVMGTAAYLAPELIDGEEPTPACDVYSAGITLYELVSGNPPFSGHIAAIMQAHLRKIADRPASVPDRLWELITACLSKEPAGRPSASQLADALDDIADVYRSPSAEGSRPPYERHRTPPASPVPYHTPNPPAAGALVFAPSRLDDDSMATSNASGHAPLTDPSLTSDPSIRSLSPRGLSPRGLSPQGLSPRGLSPRGRFTPPPDGSGTPDAGIGELPPRQRIGRRPAWIAAGALALVAVATTSYLAFGQGTNGPAGSRAQAGLSGVAAADATNPAHGHHNDPRHGGNASLGSKKPGATGKSTADPSTNPTATASANPTSKASSSPSPRHSASPSPKASKSAPPANTAWSCGPSSPATLRLTGADTGQTIQGCIRVYNGLIEIEGILTGVNLAWSEQVHLGLRDGVPSDAELFSSPTCTSSTCTYTTSLNPGAGDWFVVAGWMRFGNFQSGAVGSPSVQFGG